MISLLLEPAKKPYRETHHSFSKMWARFHLLRSCAHHHTHSPPIFTKMPWDAFIKTIKLDITPHSQSPAQKNEFFPTWLAVSAI